MKTTQGYFSDRKAGLSTFDANGSISANGYIRTNGANVSTDSNDSTRNMSGMDFHYKSW